MNNRTRDVPLIVFSLSFVLCLLLIFFQVISGKFGKSVNDYLVWWANFSLPQFVLIFTKTLEMPFKNYKLRGFIPYFIVCMLYFFTPLFFSFLDHIAQSEDFNFINELWFQVFSLIINIIFSIFFYYSLMIGYIVSDD